MDFVGDEDAVRYALKVAVREHEKKTRECGVPLDSLPDAGIARTFLAELNARGWRVSKTEPEKEPDFDLALSNLKQAADLLEEASNIARKGDALFVSGVISGALMILGELIEWTEEGEEDLPPEEKPS